MSLDTHIETQYLLSKAISTYTENNTVQTELEFSAGELSQKIFGAKNILFLGFGFHEQNLKYFTWRGYAEDKQNQQPQNICGTSYGVGKSSLSAALNTISQNFGVALSPENFPNTKIDEFFQNHTTFN